MYVCMYVYIYLSISMITQHKNDTMFNKYDRMLNEMKIEKCSSGPVVTKLASTGLQWLT